MLMIRWLEHRLGQDGMWNVLIGWGNSLDGWWFGGCMTDEGQGICARLVGFIGEE
jgi:hypothetical protein